MAFFCFYKHVKMLIRNLTKEYEENDFRPLRLGVTWRWMCNGTICSGGKLVSCL